MNRVQRVPGRRKGEFYYIEPVVEQLEYWGQAQTTDNGRQLVAAHVIGQLQKMLEARDTETRELLTKALAVCNRSCPGAQSFPCDETLADEIQTFLNAAPQGVTAGDDQRVSARGEPVGDEARVGRETGSDAEQVPAAAATGVRSEREPLPMGDPHPCDISRYVREQVLAEVERGLHDLKNLKRAGREVEEARGVAAAEFHVRAMREKL